MLTDLQEHIADRKRGHLEICAQQAVEFRQKTTLLECIDFIHQPITNLSLDDIDTSATLLGRKLSFPLVITGMTGGTLGGQQFNNEVAALAEQLGIAFGVGSQRITLRQRDLVETFQVRKQAPHVLLLANLGIAQARLLATAEVYQLVQDIAADAICLHLNTAMEIVQKNGDRDFTGSLAAIERLAGELPVPVIVKETGCGFSREAGQALMKAGVRYIDVAGAGGTSWVGVEAIRNSEKRAMGELFWDWGIPTAASLCELRSFKLHLIASGGIRTGLDLAKSLALGATAAGMALPVLRAYLESGIVGVAQLLHQVHEAFRLTLLLCGCRQTADLTLQQIIITGKLREWICQRGLQLT